MLSLPAQQAQLEAASKRVLVTAMTGQAAELIGGVTLHSAAGYAKVEKVKGFHIPKRRWSLLASLDTLIIDECSMLSAEFLQHLAEALTHARLSATWQREERKRKRQLGSAYEPRPQPACPTLGGGHTCWHCLQATEKAAEREAALAAVTPGRESKNGRHRRPHPPSHSQRQGEEEAALAAGGSSGDELAGGSDSEPDVQPQQPSPDAEGVSGTWARPLPPGNPGGIGAQEGPAGQRWRRRRRSSVDPRKPLAGLQIVFSGDFLQLPPVTKEGEHNDQKEASPAAKSALLRKIQDPKNGGQLQPGKMHDNAPFLNRGLAFASKAWKALGVRVHELRCVHRQAERGFINILHAIRTGDHKGHHLDSLGRMCCRPLSASPQHIIPTELFATNACVDATNQQELAKLQAQPHVFRAHDYVEPKSYPSDAKPFEPGSEEGDAKAAAVAARRQELLEDMAKQVLGTHSRIPCTLVLKEQAQVMLAANLCMDPYLVNGSRGVVVGWADARRERWLLEREIEVLEATLCMLQMSDDDDFNVALPGKRGPGAPGATWLVSAAQQQPPPPLLPPLPQQQQQQGDEHEALDQHPPATPQQGPPPPANTPLAIDHVLHGAGPGAGESGGIPSPEKKRRLDFDALEQLQPHQQQQQQQQGGGVGSCALPGSPPGSSIQQQEQHHEPSGSRLQQGSQQAAVGAGRPEQQQSQAPFLLSASQPVQPEAAMAVERPLASQGELPPTQPLAQSQQLEPAGTPQQLPLSRQATPPLETLFGPQLPMLEQQGLADGAAGAPQSAAENSWEAGASTQHTGTQQSATPQLPQPQQQQQPPPQQFHHAQQQQQQQQEQQQQELILLLRGPDGHISFPYRKEPLPKRLAIARAELRALVALLRARGEADLEGREVEDATVAVLRLSRQCQPQATTPSAAGSASAGGAGCELGAATPPAKAGRGGHTPSMPSGSGRLMLPLVLFQSCPQAPVVVKPREFRHQVRNVGDIVRVQLPLVLAWAMSIHKSQGATLDRVRVDLANCFATGQVYVALSRARSMEGLEVLNLDARRIKTCQLAKRFYQRGGEWPFGSEFPCEGDVQSCFLEALRAQRPLRLSDLPPYLVRQVSGGAGTKPVPGPGQSAGLMAGAEPSSSTGVGQVTGGPSQAPAPGQDAGAIPGQGALPPFSPQPRGIRPTGVMPAGSEGGSPEMRPD
ncbi:hypothetical protein N2152v2_005282 [Parachlorella kessleri]